MALSPLTELGMSLGRIEVEVDHLHATQGAPAAAIVGLAGTVNALMSMVEELKTPLTAEEQAVVDEAMVSVNSMLTKVDSLLVGSYTNWR